MENKIDLNWIHWKIHPGEHMYVPIDDNKTGWIYTIDFDKQITKFRSEDLTITEFIPHLDIGAEDKELYHSGQLVCDEAQVFKNLLNEKVKEYSSRRIRKFVLIRDDIMTIRDIKSKTYHSWMTVGFAIFVRDRRQKREDLPKHPKD